MVRGSGHDPDYARARAAAALARLTVRQQLVVVWMTAGFSSDEIARHLAITQQELNRESAQITQIASRMRR